MLGSEDEPETPDQDPVVPSYQARDLVGQGGTAMVQLGDQIYELRITKKRKLILTKPEKRETPE